MLATIAPNAQPTIINQANDTIGLTPVRDIPKYTTNISRQTLTTEVIRLAGMERPHSLLKKSNIEQIQPEVNAWMASRQSRRGFSHDAQGRRIHGRSDGRAEHLEVAIPDRPDRQNRQDGNKD